MTLPSNHKDWLLYLAKRLDREAPRAKFLRNFTSGKAPLPEMNNEVREGWKNFQKRARGGYASLIVSSLVNRMVPIGVTVDGKAAPPRQETSPTPLPTAVEGGGEQVAPPVDLPEGPEVQAAREAAQVWKDTMFGVMITDTLSEAFTVGTGYMLIEQDEEGPVVTVEKAETFFAEPNKLRPWKTEAAVQTWRDEEAEQDFARVWWNGERRDYRRTSRQLESRVLRRRVSGDDWVLLIGSLERYKGAPPAYILKNRDGFGEFEKYVDNLNRTDYSVLSRLVTTSAQAFRQRFIEGDLPELDEDGNEINWDDAFAPHPGAVWNLPGDVKLKESQSTDIRPLLAAEERDLRDLSATTETPLAALVPDGANQSAEGAAFQKEAIVTKANDRIKRSTPVFEKVMERLLEIAGVNLVGVIELQWEPTDRVTLAEKYDAAVKAKSAGESWQSIARNILGYSAEQIQQDAIDRANEQLTMQLMAPPVEENQAGSSGDNLRAPGN